MQILCTLSITFEQDMYDSFLPHSFQFAVYMYVHIIRRYVTVSERLKNTRSDSKVQCLGPKLSGAQVQCLRRTLPDDKVKCLRPTVSDYKIQSLRPMISDKIQCL